MGLFAFGRVEIICGQTHNEIIPQRLGAMEQADVAEMKGIKGPVGDDFLQESVPLIRNDAGYRRQKIILLIGRCLQLLVSTLWCLGSTIGISTALKW